MSVPSFALITPDLFELDAVVGEPELEVDGAVRERALQAATRERAVPEIQNADDDRTACHPRRARHSA